MEASDDDIQHRRTEDDDSMTTAARPLKRARRLVDDIDSSSTRTRWDHLPAEILYRVARQCPLESLARLGLVDRRTHAVTLDQRLWRRLYRTADGKHELCSAGASCPHARHQSESNKDTRHKTTIENATRQVRRWLNVEARSWIIQHGRGDGVDIPPWQWHVFRRNPLGNCVCHVPCAMDDTHTAKKGANAADGNHDHDDSDREDEEDEEDDGLRRCDPQHTDYRWLYASSVVGGVAYQRVPSNNTTATMGIMTPNVGYMGLYMYKWQPLSALGWPLISEICRGSGMASYSGDMDDDFCPDGVGTLTLIAAPGVARSGRVLFRISGGWRHGKPDGMVRACNYTRKGDMLYFHGRCNDGKPRHRGLAVYRDSVFDGVWNDGFPSGAGLSCFADRLVRYGTHRRSLYTTMWHVILRPDGTIACEDAFTDEYDDSAVGMYKSESDTDDDDGDGNDDDEQKDRLDVASMLKDASRRRAAFEWRAPTVSTGHTAIRARSGNVVYTGPLTGEFGPKPYRGTVSLRDGTQITHVGRVGSPLRRMVSIAYSGGDSVACLFQPSGIEAGLPRVLEFTYSHNATNDLACHTLQGPWHVVAMPHLYQEGHGVQQGQVPALSQMESVLGHVADIHNDDSAESGQIDRGSNDGASDGTLCKRMSVVDCPPGVVVTQLARDPPNHKTLDDMAALADFAFWPTERGQERDAFFKHMITYYGARWAACRVLADDLP